MNRSTSTTSVLIILLFLGFGMGIGDARVPDAILNQGSAVLTIYINNDKGETVTTGSGFVVNPNGMIATNYHVVSNWLEDLKMEMVVKMHTGAYFPVENVLVTDQRNDVAIIKISARNLPAVRLSRRAKPKLGETVVIVGSPRGLEASVSDGIVSSLREDGRLIQLTAPVSPGSSGSPVFDSKGEVIGMATFMLKEAQNLNFAVHVKCIIDAVGEVGRQTPVEGIWRTNGGSSLKVERKGDDLKAYLQSASDPGFQQGYNKGDLVFHGKLRGQRITGTFVARYGQSHRYCYPEGRAIPCEGRINLEGKSAEVTFVNKAIDLNCRDVGDSKATMSFTRGE